MGTSLRVVVRPEGVELTQAAIQSLARATAQAAREAAQASTGSIGEVTSGLDHQLSHSSLRITEAMQRAAASGATAGHGLQKVVDIGASMAMMFGAAGPIVAGIGIVALTITHLFSGAREEMQKTHDKAKQLLNDTDQVGLVKELRDLTLGTRGEHFEDSLGGLQGKSAFAQSIAGSLNNTAFGPFANLLAVWTGKKAKDRAEAIKYLTDELLNPAGRTSGVGGLPPVRIEAKKTEEEFPAMEVPTMHELIKKLVASIVADDKAESWQDFKPLQEEIEKGLAKSLSDMPGEMAKQIEEGFKGADGLRFTKSLEASMRDLAKRMKWITLQNEFGAGIGAAVSGGIVMGLQTAVAGGTVGNAFRALAQSIMGEMSKLLVDVALRALGFAELMAKFQLWLIANPWAAIGIAAAMVVLARSFASGGAGGGAAAGGGGFSSSGYGNAVGAAETTRILWGADSATVAAGMTPRPANQFIIIGPNDPTAQRGILELIRKAERRG